jgi:hypothetical protein
VLVCQNPYNEFDLCMELLSGTDKACPNTGSFMSSCGKKS